MEVVVTTGAISRAKLQSNHHHQQTSIQPTCFPSVLFTSVLWHCWLGDRKGIRPVKLDVGLYKTATCNIYFQSMPTINITSSPLSPTASLSSESSSAACSITACSDAALIRKSRDVLILKCCIKSTCPCSNQCIVIVQGLQKPYLTSPLGWTFQVVQKWCCIPQILQNVLEVGMPCLHSSTAFAQKIWGFCMQDTTGLQVSS